MRLRLSSERNAFTLIEIMVVVALIGIMTAMILPEMKGTYEDALLRSTGREMVNACNLAYSRAVSYSQPHRVRINAVTGKYIVEKRVRGQGRDEFVPLRDVPGGEGTLDTRIKFEFHRPDELPGAEPVGSDDPAVGQETAIGFYADGTADAVEATLRDREGFQLVLKVNPTTARVQVESLEREAAGGGLP